MFYDPEFQRKNLSGKICDKLKCILLTLRVSERLGEHFVSS